MSDDPPLLPPIPLFLAHAPHPARNAWGWLWRFDQRLVRLAAEPSEAMLAQIRLAWWRDQLSGQGKAGERRDPLLIELDVMAATSRSIAREQAIRLVDAIEAIAHGERDARWAGAEERGDAIARALADLIDTDDIAAQRVGTYWGLMQLAPVEHGDTDWQARAASLEHEAKAHKVPRPLSLMRLHAGLLHRAEGEPLGPGAGLRLMAHGLTGL